MRTGLFVVIALSLCVSTFAQEQNAEDKKDKGLLGGVEKIVSAVTAFKPVFDMFRTEKSTKMGELQHQKGFKNLDTSHEFHTGTVRRHNLNAMFASWIQDLPLTFNVKSQLTKYVKNAQFDEFIDPYQTVTQDFKFGDANGNLHYFKAVLVAHPTVVDAIRWEKILWSAKFQVAAPFCIVTKSKSGIMGSKVTDSVQYFQAVLTPDHIEAIKQLSIPFMQVSTPSGQIVINREGN